MSAPSNDYITKLFTLCPRSEYHEDLGTVLWWHLPVEEPPEVGRFPDELPEGYPEDWHTHFSPLPDPHMMSASDGVEV